MDMLEQAERRFNGYAHIKCIQSDVGNLQMDDESFDIVLSMNGFHAFPDKKKHFRKHGVFWNQAVLLLPVSMLLKVNQKERIGL